MAGSMSYEAVSRKIYKAIINDNWDPVKQIFQAHPERLYSTISSYGETPLYIAVGINRSHHFVENLVNQIMLQENALEKLRTPSTSKNLNALHEAARCDNITDARLLVTKDSQMPNALDCDGKTPLEVASSVGNEEMIRYLMSITEIYHFMGDRGACILGKIINSGLYDLALDVVKDYPHLVAEVNDYSREETALGVLAAQENAFPSVSKLGLVKRLIYAQIPLNLKNTVDSNPGQDQVDVVIEDGRRSRPTDSLSFLQTCFGKGSVVFWNAFSYLVPCIKHIRDIKLRHLQAEQLLKGILSVLLQHENGINLPIIGNAIQIAIAHGSHELVEECVTNHPEIIWYNVEANVATNLKVRKNILVNSRRHTMLACTHVMKEGPKQERCREEEGPTKEGSRDEEGTSGYEVSIEKISPSKEKEYPLSRILGRPMKGRPLGPRLFKYMKGRHSERPKEGSRDEEGPSEDEVSIQEISPSKLKEYGVFEIAGRPIKGAPWERPPNELARVEGPNKDGSRDEEGPSEDEVSLVEITSSKEEENILVGRAMKEAPRERPKEGSRDEEGPREDKDSIKEISPSTETPCTKKGYDLFESAIKHRQEKVFSLMYQISAQRSRILSLVDGENALHLVSKLASYDRLSAVTGVALQMQRELLWFKEVEKFTDPVQRREPNSEYKTPRMVFNEEHKQLLEDAQQWTKDTASSSTVVASLLITITFAAMFTVPGGNNDVGKSFFARDRVFLLFVISDAIALFSSSTSVLMFLSTLTHSSQEDFLYALPLRLTLGLISLFISLATTMVAFSATLVLVLRDEIRWIAGPVTLLASVPALLFLWLQYPLLQELIGATFGRSIFPKRSNVLLH